MLKALAENKLEKRIYIRADEAVAYGKVMEVLALCRTPASPTPACRSIPPCRSAFAREGDLPA